MTKTALITGCSTGFGEATARLFAERGWNVIASMRRPEADTTLSGLRNILVAQLDVQDRDSIDAAIAAGIARFGKIDVLVNNAGFGLWGVFETTPRDKVMEQFEVNVFGMMDVTRALLPHFRASRSGMIVNVSSGAGIFGLPMISLYTASKFALEGFSESLSYELAPLGITVKIVEPGGVTSTDFGKRSGIEAGISPALADYGQILSAASAVFDGLRADRTGATSVDVAGIIFEAATDGSDQLRYVATEQIKPLVAARRETSEADYIAFMRNRFALALP